MTETRVRKGGATPAPARDGAIERMLRRALLLLTRDTSTVQDRLDLAELADAVGAPGLSRLARDTAMLRQGFAAEPAAIDAPLGSIERAVRELTDLIREPASPLAANPPGAMDATAACAAFCRLLAAPLDTANEAALAGLLIAWRELAEAPQEDPQGHAGDGLDALSSAFAARELLAFLRRNHDIAFAPYGSARLLHRAAHLAMGGLGPYLTGVGNIVRSGRDILGLITLAGGNPTQVARWVVPLAAHLPEHIAIALADDLADLGMIDAIRGLLAAALRRPDQLGLLRHLRDATLDLGDDLLALSAQHGVLGLAKFEAVEWRCMGDMLAAADADGAMAAYAYAAKIAPGDAQTESRIAAARAGDLQTFAVTGGFATPRPRQLIRFARRAA